MTMSVQSSGGAGHAESSAHEKSFDIIVNAQQKRWGEEQISFDQVVKLAFPNPPSGSPSDYTVTFSKGPQQNPQGTLLPGQSVFVKNRMVFDVVPTVKS